MATKYGVLLPQDGIALRGLFLIDPKGITRQITINDLPVGRSVEETIRLIKGAFSRSLFSRSVCFLSPCANKLTPFGSHVNSYSSFPIVSLLSPLRHLLAVADLNLENIFCDVCVVQHGRARRGLPGRLVARRQLGHDQALANREQGVLRQASCGQGQGGALRASTWV